MDELDMRRRCIAAPNDTDPQFLQWLEDQPQARQCQRQARQFDEQLRFALQQVEVPDGLNGRLLLGTGLKARQRIRRRWVAGFAMAASLLLSVGLLRTPGTAPADFQQLALNHVYDEMHHLEHASSPVSASLVGSLFEQLGGRLKGSLGEIRFAFMCPTPQGQGLHLIADNAAGRVTVLYVPEADRRTQAVAFADQRFSGRTLLPAPGGALAVIGENPQAVAQMEAALQQAVQWDSAPRLAGQRVPGSAEDAA